MKRTANEQSLYPSSTGPFLADRGILIGEEHETPTPAVALSIRDALGRILPIDGTHEAFQKEQADYFGRVHWRRNSPESPRVYVSLSEYFDFLKRIVQEPSLTERASMSLHPTVLKWLDGYTDPKKRAITFVKMLFDYDHADVYVRYSGAGSHIWRTFSDLVLEAGGYSASDKFQPKGLFWLHGTSSTNFICRTRQALVKDGLFELTLQPGSWFPEFSQKGIAVLDECSRIFGCLQKIPDVEEIEFRPGVAVVPRPSWRRGEAELLKNR